MAKVNIKSEKITPFGGFYYASKAFSALSLDKVINGTLGVRSSTYNGYQWNEIMSAMSDVFLRGGDCVEDVNRSECHLRESPEVRIPTSHTIGRTIKELSQEDMVKTDKRWLIKNKRLQAIVKITFNDLMTVWGLILAKYHFPQHANLSIGLIREKHCRIVK